jgi:WD40 repeat protein
MLALGSPAQAQPPVGQPARDADGDVLPAGAVARIGSKRWRVPSEPEWIALSPDGKLLAVTTRSCTTELLDARTGRLVQTLGTPTYSERSDVSRAVAMSSDMATVASAVASNDGSHLLIEVRHPAGAGATVRISFRQREGFRPTLPARAQAEIDKKSVESEYVSALSLSPDGGTLAAAVRYYFACWPGDDVEHPFLKIDENSVRLWDTSSGKELARMEGACKETFGLRFSPDGQTLAGVDAGGVVRTWEATTGREKARWASDRPLRCAAFSPDGRWLALGGAGGVAVCSADAGKVRSRPTLPDAKPTPAVTSVCFSPDGKLIAGACGASVRVWTAASGSLVCGRELAENPIECVAFSSDGAVLFTGHSRELTVRRWAGATLRAVDDVDGNAALVRGLAFTGDGKQLVTCSVGSDVNVGVDRSLWQRLADRSIRGDVRAWSVRGELVSPGKQDRDRLVGEWLRSVGRSSPLLSEDLVARMSRDLSGHFPCMEGALRLVGASVGGDRLLREVTEDGQQALEVHGGESEQPVRRFRYKKGAPVAGALSPDGRTLAVAGNGLLRVLDVDSGKERSFKVPTKRYGPAQDPYFRTDCVKFSPDGSRVAVLGDDKKLRVVSVVDGWQIQAVDVSHGVDVSQHAFDPPSANRGIGGWAISPDGKTLLVYTDLDFPDSTWEVEAATGQTVRKHRSTRLLFSPDNRLVADCGGLGRPESVALYDLYGGQLVRRCKGDADLTGNVVFSPDGSLLAASLTDTTVLIWETGRPADQGRSKVLDGPALERLWHDLRERKASEAYPAIGKLIAEPDRAVPFLRQRLHAAQPVSDELIRQLIAQLDDDTYRVRETASQRLSELGTLARPALRATLDGMPASAEVRARLRSLLQEIEQRGNSPVWDELAHVRAIQVLEQVRSPEALRLLKLLADGAEGAPRTRDAREALQRIAKQAAR